MIGTSGRPDRVIDVVVGQVLPPVVRSACRAQLFLFSAATNNPHRIHYDIDFAKAEGHDDVLVQGSLQGAWLAQYVMEWVGPAGRLLYLKWRNRRPLYAEESLVLTGTVSTVGPGQDPIDLALAGRVETRTVVDGSASITTPGAGTPGGWSTGGRDEGS